MLNYMKSEFYRIIHGRQIYGFTAALSAAAILFNIILYLFNRFDPNFPYGNIWFSMNNLTGSMTVVFMGGLALASILFADEHKNGTLKNAISFGISRGQFFTGKCIVCGVVCILSMLVILTAFMGSAYLLLDGAGDVTLFSRIKGVMVNIPAAYASVILAVAFLCMFKKDVTAIIWWIGIMWAVPTFCFYMGLKIDWLGSIAEWMPWNYLKFEVAVNMSQYQCLWDTSQGLAKCLIAGGIGIIVFYIGGRIAFRKKEIA